MKFAEITSFPTETLCSKFDENWRCKGQVVEIENANHRRAYAVTTFLHFYLAYTGWPNSKTLSRIIIKSS